MKTFKIKIDVPRDFQPGECELCEFYWGALDNMHCDLDSRCGPGSCPLSEIDETQKSTDWKNEEINWDF